MGNPSRRVPPALHCIHRSRGVAVQGSQPRHGVLRADACRRPARSGLPLPLPLARRTRTRRRAVDFARDGRPAEQFSRKMCGFACGIAISHTHTHTARANPLGKRWTVSWPRSARGLQAPRSRGCPLLLLARAATATATGWAVAGTARCCVCRVGQNGT